MKSKKLRLGMLVMVLGFGIMVVGNIDAQTDSRLNGTWLTTIGYMETQLMMNNGSYESSGTGASGARMLIRGTYTTNGNVLVMTPTHIHGSGFDAFGLDSRWYSRNELIITMRNLGVNEAQFNDIFGIMFLQTTQTFAISGNTLNITATQVYSRR